MPNHNYDATMAQVLTQIARQNIEGRGETRSDKSERSWLAAMVEALNELIKEGFDDMMADSRKVSKSDPRTLTDFQVSSQVFSLLMNTAQTVVKTVGEANANAARKQ